MAADPISDTIEAISKLIGNLKGQSRIEKLAILAQITTLLAKAAEATNDPEIDEAIDAIAEAVTARAEQITEKIRGS